jgi:predicted RNA binding protein YcfA (HicA-like mRNA interferase family)
VSERLPSIPPRQLIRVLEQKGWKLARSKGSHHHFTHPDSPNVVTIAVHAKDVKRGTLSGILSDAGISRDEFLSLLK